MMEKAEEFKIESLDLTNTGTVKKQLGVIFKSDQDISNFVTFLKNMQKFITLSNDRRHTTLLDLIYFKSQVELYERRVAGLIAEIKNKQTKNAIVKAKQVGEKLTENIIVYYSEDDASLRGLEQIYSLAKTWLDYLTDLYYISGQTNKILGNMSGL